MLTGADEKTSAYPHKWDLTDFYAAVDDGQIRADVATLLKKAAGMRRRYQGRLKSLSPQRLNNLLRAYETLCERFGKISSFAYLNYVLQTDEFELSKLLRWVEEQEVVFSAKLTFIYIELSQMGQVRLRRLSTHAGLKHFSHYLSRTADYCPHVLSEKEEVLLEKKSLTSDSAFAKLFTQMTSQRTFKFLGKSLTQEELLTMVRTHPDRSLRRRAASQFTAGLQRDLKLATYIHNTLIQDKRLSDETRGYRYPEQARHLANEIPPEVAETVGDVVAASYPKVVGRYYRLKSQILGVPRLLDYDRHAPQGPGQARIDYAQSIALVRRAYRSFSPRVGKIVDKMFSHAWIDVYPARGKTGGAFCYGVSPAMHPLILLNYTDSRNDTRTLAHELGHALHDFLAYPVGYFRYHPPLVLAEAASTFGEMLTFRSLLDGAKTARERLGLVTDFIEDSISTIHRQTALYQFEKHIHRHYWNRGELSTGDFSAYWVQTQSALYAGSVGLSQGYSLWWSYIPHFVNSPFYVYAYAFGQLLVYALWQSYLTEGKRFVPKYLELLSAGGSRSPSDLLWGLKIDIADQKFWESGITFLESYVHQAENLWEEVKS